MAHYDPLTDLPNRLLFGEALEKCIVRCQRQPREFALLALNLDGFKAINDTLGHTCGDLLLHDVAERLLSATRAVDTVGRLSGDEFLVLLEETTGPQSVVPVIEKLLDVFRRPFNLADQEIFVTASIGVCFYPHDGDGITDLLQHADAALVAAKREGKNTYTFFSQKHSQSSTLQLFIQNVVRTGQIDDYFCLVYQPQVDMQTGAIIGTEALIRFRERAGFAMAPDEFIPVIEQSSVIRDIGCWVLNTACAQLRSWQQSGLEPGCMAVNVAANHLRHPSFMDAVTRAIDQSGIDPGQLELEITERIASEPSQDVLDTLCELRTMGVSISIDDFGTGYSSLSYLHRLPIDRIKIDRAFVSGLPDSRDNVSVTTAIIAVANSLELAVIAEGIETEEQERFLLYLRCRYAQGFLYGKPQAAADLAQVLQRSSSGVPA
ncbi:bifunctional diguanylate cyclase/phosphodiesterase [Synechococcus sp. RSCCF101]|uniref:putative bifunctional diguanylate cyclase/phosphodiesterase n=1 Tax=Synechococcus sp. RSCCF101 TaxID=2511069 RepID=UPI001CDA2CFF|nr:bifunctional diguanylate cyclase/phosphodiesterase [Synechococcus sp. RSCCF101]